MMSMSSRAEHWRQRLYEKLPANLKTWAQAGARAHLLKQVNCVLMVHDERLYDLSNGAWRSLQPGAEGSVVASLAATARELLAPGTEPRAVLLLLPSSHFIATAVTMPGVARENLHSALQLQAPILLPSYEGTLALAINAAARDPEYQDIALWTDEGALNALFDAFAAQDLLLAAVLPRALAARNGPLGPDTLVVEDMDASSITQLVYRKGVLCSWLQVERADLQDPELQAQWQETSVFAQAGATRVQRLAAASDWVEQSTPAHWDAFYCFLPAGAQAVRRQLEKGRRLKLVAVAAAAAVLLLASPFLWQAVHIRTLESSLAAQQTLSADARANQAVVRDFEQRWGVLNEFPRQDVAQTLLQLQNVLSPNVLSSLELVEGELQIEGESPDPQSLLQQLEQDPMFTGVDFARATSNNRYYIEMRLSTVDFDGYRERYFPDVRR